MQKVMSAVNMGAEAIMDLSSHGNTQPFRQKLTRECPVMIGTVPVYDSVIHYQRIWPHFQQKTLLTSSDACGRRRAISECDTALWNYKKDDRTDQKA